MAFALKIDVENKVLEEYQRSPTFDYIGQEDMNQYQLGRNISAKNLVEGMMIGQDERYVRVIYPNSEVYLGITTSNLTFSGPGTLTLKDGTAKTGYWADGRCFANAKEYQMSYLEAIFRSPPLQSLSKGVKINYFMAGPFDFTTFIESGQL